MAGSSEDKDSFTVDPGVGAVGAVAELSFSNASSMSSNLLSSSTTVDKTSGLSHPQGRIRFAPTFVFQLCLIHL